MLAWSDHDPDFGAAPPAVTRARFRFSTVVDRLHPPAAGMGILSAGDYLQNEWAWDESGSFAALYTDSTIGNLFALAALNADSFHGVYFMPHADGSPSHTYTVHSDFSVMEDMICTNVAQFLDRDCGPINVLQ